MFSIINVIENAFETKNWIL